MKYDIIDKFTDLAGKIRIIVDLGSNEATMFKFNKEPDNLKGEVDRYLVNKSVEDAKNAEEKAKRVALDKLGDITSLDDLNIMIMVKQDELA